MPGPSVQMLMKRVDGALIRLKVALDLKNKVAVMEMNNSIMEMNNNTREMNKNILQRTKDTADNIRTVKVLAGVTLACLAVNFILVMASSDSSNSQAPARSAPPISRQVQIFFAQTILLMLAMLTAWYILTKRLQR
ncbi:hypothetical protein AJ80_05077 [Polytolypa hystricis UAMH7299]|uniref:Uncharacterized protein n=1 Tax=Polytolypa hystricis (strain UAMH7299) TaxID=1447883 RepID=A0A2B7Y7A0_POLH7|nr:hypothetical protein AJ80_05077 [Polytolypa hystricis UAMH7299]